MNTRTIALAAGLFALSTAGSASAQIVVQGPVVYGHHHANHTSAAEGMKFWTTLGGTPARFGMLDIVSFPNVLVFMREQAPTGGTRGTSVNHVGFAVPNIRRSVQQAEAAGYGIVTRDELPPSLDVDGGVATVGQGVAIAFVMGPDDTMVELVEDRSMSSPAALHHIHFAGQQPEEMRDWYVKTFGATPGGGGLFPSANLPGVSLSFSPSQEPVEGTEGHAMDHIGFEIENLEAFTKNLESMGMTLEVPYRHVDALNLSIAFVRDPWGTYIELTEGLDLVE